MAKCGDSLQVPQGRQQIAVLGLKFCLRNVTLVSMECLESTDKEHVSIDNYFSNKPTGTLTRVFSC